jgi:4-amino-4-deoxy-L-arabinose transferase-like glycosyltransferase
VTTFPAAPTGPSAGTAATGTSTTLDPPAAQAHAATASTATRVVLLATLLGAFAWRVHALGFQSLWRDEVDAVYFALRPVRETAAMFTQMAQNGPLYFLSLRPWLLAAGSSEVALRLPSAAAGTIAVALLWQVGRPLLAPQRGAALLAAALLAINPYQLWYSQEGKMYAVVGALALAATWAWLRGVERGGWKPWLAYWLLVTLAIYVHLLTVLIVPLHLLWFALAWPQSKRRWRGYALALAGLTLPYLPLALWQWDMLMAAQRVTGFHYVPLPQMLRALALNHARGFLPTESLLLVAPLLFLAAAGILLGWAELDPVGRGDAPPRATPFLSGWRRHLMIVAWLCLPVLLIWLLSLRQPVYTDRYVLWVAPAVMLLVALGAQAVRSNLGRAGLPIAALLCLYVAGLWLAAGWHQKTTVIKYDLRAAVRAVSARRDQADLLILQIPHMEWAYRYYSGDQGTAPFAGSEARLGRWAGGLWTNDGAPDEVVLPRVEAEMAQMTRGVDEVWLLLSEPEMWDARRLTDAWLNAHAALVESADFHGAQVRRYRFEP